jgi:hypothetical protein
VKTAAWGPLTLDINEDHIGLDAEGGLTFRLMLASDEQHLQERSRNETTRATEWGAKYRKRLAHPIGLTLRLDLAGVRALAVGACRNKSGSAKDGPLIVRGGKGARFVRIEGWTDEEAKG